jgi:hypothetical protein
VSKLNQQKINALIETIAKGNLQKVKSAISALKSNGNHTVVQPLIEIVNQCEDVSIQNEIWHFFHDLSDSSVAAEVIACLQNELYLPIHIPLLNSMWNSKINYSEYLHILVAKAIEGDFMTAVECLTIIENLDGPFYEQSLFEAQLLLRAVPSDKQANEQKKYILSEIAMYVKRFEHCTD